MKRGGERKWLAQFIPHNVPECDLEYISSAEGGQRRCFATISSVFFLRTVQSVVFYPHSLKNVGCISSCFFFCSMCISYFSESFFPLSPDDAVTSELSKLLHEIKKCRDRDYSFEELCHTISSHSMDSFGSGRLSDEERPDRPNGTLTRVGKVQLSYDTGLVRWKEFEGEILLLSSGASCKLSQLS